MESEQQKVRLSSWPLMVASIFLAVATHYLFGLYGTVHWKVAGPSVHLTIHVLSLKMSNEADSQQIKRAPDETATIEQMTKETDKLRQASSSLMRRTGVYRFTGWMSLGLAILTIYGKPRWAGWVALPLALYAVGLSMIMM